MPPATNVNKHTQMTIKFLQSVPQFMQVLITLASQSDRLNQKNPSLLRPQLAMFPTKEEYSTAIYATLRAENALPWLANIQSSTFISPAR